MNKARLKRLLDERLPKGAGKEIFAYLTANQIVLTTVPTNNDYYAIIKKQESMEDGSWCHIDIGEEFSGYAFLYLLLHEIAHHYTDDRVMEARHHGKDFQSNLYALLRQYRDIFPPAVNMAIDVLFSQYTVTRESELIYTLYAITTGEMKLKDLTPYKVIEMFFLDPPVAVEIDDKHLKRNIKS